MEKSEENSITNSRIGQSVIIQGNIESSEDIIIDGRVEGNVFLHDHQIIVSPSARIRGEIKAREIILEGKVEGNLVATGKVTVTSKAELNGDIIASLVAVEDGARFKGTIKITPSS